jgi:class 3 adenylate cyclase/tetratricopeptide (TPR) repeat protein
MSVEVSKWLENLGLGQYASLFEENDIGWDLLGDIDQETLKDIGVNSAGHRLQILKAAKKLHLEETTLIPTSTTADTTEAPPPEPDAHTMGGEDTTAWTRTPGERKPVTMLFADIVGSTALTEKLDAEDAHDLLYRATQLMCQSVEDHKGTVCRFMGDGIMAMFGAPVASERHALEACRAAIDMLADVADYSNALGSDQGNGIDIRVGLNSGEVVVLEVGDDPEKPEYDASGPTVPLAARMEQLAEPGMIWITENTRALAGDLIETTGLPSVSVKGISEPVAVYRLQAVKSATESHGDAAKQPLVGRKSELAQFNVLMTTCLESGHGQIVFVRGEAGIGKTRLIEEMANLARVKGFSCHKALVLDFGAGKGQEAIPSLVRSLLNIAPGSNKPERKAAFEKADNAGIVESEHRVFFNDLLDLEQSPELESIYDAMNPQARNDGKCAAVAALLQNLSASKPLIVVVEDLHWADRTTLNYLAALVSVAPEVSALIVFTSRAEGDPLDASWRARSGEISVVTLDLSPLRREEAVKLVNDFIDASDQLAQRCIERAAGNPLFLKQLLLSVGNDSGDVVPDSIKSLVLSRVDQLPEKDKRALQAAAILGQRFDSESLRFLLDDPDYQCWSLVERHLLRPEGPAFLFAHALIRDGAYSSILKNQRCDLHRRAADYFAERDPVLFARHLEMARDDRAPRAYLDAARYESTKYRLDSALDLVSAGIELSDRSADLYSLRCLQGDLQSRLGGLQESAVAYKKALECAGNPAEQCSAWIGLAHVHTLLDKYDKSHFALGNAETLATDNLLDEELFHIFSQRGNLYFITGDTAGCHDQHMKAYQLAQKLGSEKLMAKALSGLGDAELMASKYLSAFRYFDQCVELCESNDFDDMYAINLKMRADTKLYLNDRQGALEDIHKVIEFSKTAGDLKAGAFAHHTGAELELGRGRIESAREHLTQARNLFDKLGAKHYRVNNFIFWARLLDREGNMSEALKSLEKGDAISRETGSDWMRAWLLGQLALIADNSKTRLDALKEGERLIDEGSQDYIRDYFYRDGIDAALLEKDWDRVEKYAYEIEDSAGGESIPLLEFYVDRGRALAKLGRGTADADTLRQLQQLRGQAEQIELMEAIPAIDEALKSS